MAQALTHPFPLRLTQDERSALDQAYEALISKHALAFSGRTTRTDVARMALDRGLQILLQELGQNTRVPKASNSRLPHDDAWMSGGLQAAAELLPPFDWGDMDPYKDGDPIMVVAGRGAFVVG